MLKTWSSVPKAPSLLDSSQNDAVIDMSHPFRPFPASVKPQQNGHLRGSFYTMRRPATWQFVGRRCATTISTWCFAARNSATTISFSWFVGRSFATNLNCLPGEVALQLFQNMIFWENLRYNYCFLVVLLEKLREQTCLLGDVVVRWDKLR